ncbi:prepilin-type N-terminal cleavage/methylation domain-containing protein [Cronobacter malonaticus]|uniref:prepilin-type N-terminal cleavage/methylation domain-containing protein n=1 Tax=Cronobacter malonaticus TaxID=413503 RepID=UPI00289623E9|nr:prepilin-type N-terminal cleavage/methylation domain-containing protein [Cronobacter malonaticus]ELY5937609.1 prepilin-type N-terminal cleavage/methylation domain-containing protein [Cronobacter malonaticus]ELY6203008.1 prepilin-type N-terminal cleavage/methylation domain-containing protein [Cronobacter malonaticus]ELY6257140.1 prepilin-type N-terminal cleavage/methylation domain-containing protein [Cronobacter malonaticus]EMA8635988.1 prepilin-type N-terminal cleavage/methylation domain-con
MPASIARHRQTGFSLPEVLVSVVLFIVIIGALTGYYQVLAQGFLHQWHYRQLWRFASQQAEIDPPSLPEGWKATRVKTSSAGCVSISVLVSSPGGRQGQLRRLHCPSEKQ